MKRVLGLVLALSSMGFVISADAKTANASNENSTIAASSVPQWQRNRRWDRRNDRRYERRRTVTRSRYVRYGRRLYRETYLVTYWPNGRTDTRLISRTRVS
jgi:Ni/Co efflux regulator RcnB